MKKNFKISNLIPRSYIYNAYPYYQSSKKNAKYCKIIYALKKAVKKNIPSQHSIWKCKNRYHSITHKLLNNKRNMNLHRSRSIDAIIECLVSNLDVMTGKVFITLKQISDMCGLTTYGKKGIPSYSRASRAINEHIEAIGAIYCERIWDKTTGAYIPNIIWVNELFFTLIGYKYVKFLSAQKQKLALKNKKLRLLGQPSISLLKACAQAKKKHIQSAFFIRTKLKFYNKQIRKARNLVKLKKQDAQHLILKDIIKLYSYKELSKIGHAELKKEVENRYFAMKNLLHIDKYE